ncbi:hypothetical protein Ancab_013961 [Ancistrocladus abbreviatus]
MSTNIFPKLAVVIADVRGKKDFEIGVVDHLILLMAYNKKPKRIYQDWKGHNAEWSLTSNRLCRFSDITSFGYWTTKDDSRWYPVLIVGATLTVMDIVFLLLTSGRDPGIVPRDPKPPESDDAFELVNPSMEWLTGRTPHCKLPRARDVIVNGYPVKRNYPFFYMFISTASILCLYVHVFSWVALARRGNNILKAMTQDVLSDFLIVYCFIAIGFVGGLTIFHFYLICTNQTTYENFRHRYDRKENPYNKGVLCNIKETLFSKIPPSLNNFRATVLTEDPVPIDSTIPNLAQDVSPKEKIDIEAGTKTENGIKSDRKVDHSCSSHRIPAPDQRSSSHRITAMEPHEHRHCKGPSF